MQKPLAVLFATAAVGLSGCGFAPLYGQPGVVKGLAAIEVEAPQGRTGFLMREHLDDVFAKDRTAQPAYHMQLALSAFARLIGPFVPHLAEECWARVGGQGMVVAAEWPAFDPALTADAEKVLPVQVNGKRRGEITAPAGAEPAEVEKIVLDDPEIARRLEGLTIRKVIVVKDRIVNIVAA